VGEVGHVDDIGRHVDGGPPKGILSVGRKTLWVAVRLAPRTCAAECLTVATLD